jgi:taurine dioxygenase
LFLSLNNRTDIPTKITVLKSEIRPTECGDTDFANTHAAYDALSPEMKNRLRGMRAEYSYLKHRRLDETGTTEKSLNEEEVQKAKKVVIHPLVTTHPITGKKNLYANPSHTQRVLGLSLADSDALLQELFQHTEKPQFLYRHKYQDDDVILWDNRAVHHRATGCSDEFPRKLIRTTASNDDIPREDIIVTDPYNLAKDRVNAEYPPRFVPTTSIEGVHSDL